MQEQFDKLRLQTIEILPAKCYHRTMKKFFRVLGKGLDAFFGAIVYVLASLLSILLFVPIWLCFPTITFNKKALKKQKGAKIVAINHFSNLDAIIFILLVCPLKRYKFLGKKELQKVPVLGWLLRHIGVVYISRGSTDIGAIKQVNALLRKGKTLVIYPEGTRNKTGTEDLQALKTGVIMFSNLSGAPIVPAKMAHKPKVFNVNNITFGDAYLPPRVKGEELKLQAEVLAEKMKNL